MAAQIALTAGLASWGFVLLSFMFAGALRNIDWMGTITACVAVGFGIKALRGGDRGGWAGCLLGGSHLALLLVGLGLMVIHGA